MKHQSINQSTHIAFCGEHNMWSYNSCGNWDMELVVHLLHLHWTHKNSGPYFNITRLFVFECRFDCKVSSVLKMSFITCPKIPTYLLQRVVTLNRLYCVANEYHSTLWADKTAHSSYVFQISQDLNSWIHKKNTHANWKHPNILPSSMNHFTARYVSLSLMLYSSPQMDKDS